VVIFESDAKIYGIRFFIGDETPFQRNITKEMFMRIGFTSE
jgi:hypothetical protein